MSRSLVLFVAAAGVVLIAAFLWPEAPPAPPAPPALPAAAAPVAPPTPAKGERSLESMMAEEARRIREAPGRKGILAERKRYSTFDEELIIRDFFKDRRDGIFVDVGCAWPAMSSNTYYLEKHLGWSGIGIDALSEYGPDWEKLRPNSKFFNYLVTDHSGTEESFFRSPDKGLSSANREMATGKRFGEDLTPVKIEVPSITLTELLDQQGIEKIDLLVMDIEGHEYAALQGFDIARFAPELVVVEGMEGNVRRHLRANGYRVIKRFLPFDTVNRYYRRKRNRAGS